MFIMMKEILLKSCDL